MEGFGALVKNSAHINFLEMKAVLFGLESLCRDLRVKHIRVESDNTTTVAYINAMGGIKSTVCNEMALQLWQKYLDQCMPPPRHKQQGCRRWSRNFDGFTEWPFNMRVFEDVSSKRGPSQNDLFVSRSNHKVPGYVS